MGDTRPTTVSAASAPPPYPDDTVSLRELYLVWRRGLGLIIVVAVLCALGALAFKLYQGRTYTADAVVQVVRPRVSNQPGSGLEVSVASVVDAGTYQAAAEDERTLTAVAEAVDAPNGASPGAFTIVRGPGPQSGDAMTVTHRVRVSAAEGAEMAAEVANAAADVATLEEQTKFLAIHAAGLVKAVIDVHQPRLPIPHGAMHLFFDAVGWPERALGSHYLARP